MSLELNQSPTTLNAMLNLFDEDHKIQFDKDKEAARQFFLQDINKNTVYFNSLEEKVEHLVENKYWEEDFIRKYSMHFIKDLFKELYGYKHRFKTYLGALKFYNQYALKTRDGSRYLERYEDRCAAVGLYLGQGDEKLARDIAVSILKGQFQPATPTFQNAGKYARGGLTSCFLLDMFDNIESITRTLGAASVLSKNGGGIGVNFTNIREAGAPIKNIPGLSSGIIPALKVFEDSVCRYFNQLGSRQGAMVANLNIFHPDIEQFIDTKKENADEGIRMKLLSTSVLIPDVFMQEAAKNHDVPLFSPYEIYKEYGETMSEFDITGRYLELLNNPNISKKKRVNARKLLSRIAQVQAESGYPYIIYIDNANNQKQVDGRIKMSNLCTEIFQPQTPSEYNEDLSYKVIGNDISCNLGSLIIDGVIDSGDPEKIISTAVRSLTVVSDMLNEQSAPTVSKGNSEAHSIGLSAMNLHGFLSREHIYYGSDEALDFVNTFFAMMRFYALKESNKIAKERGQTFVGFSKSKYATGEFFDKYIENSYLPRYDKVADIYKRAGIALPTQGEWAWLADEVRHSGLYNRELMVVPPTGSISYIQASSPGLMPIPAPVEVRKESIVGRVYYPAPYMNNDNLEYYQDAYELGPKKIIDTFAVAQAHIDQGLSMNLYFKQGATTKDINRSQIYAWKSGLKSIYYIRFEQKALEGTEVDCVSCSI
jgi:ribonucleoside-diphosphate reductase alpha chain